MFLSRRGKEFAQLGLLTLTRFLSLWSQNLLVEISFRSTRATRNIVSTASILVELCHGHPVPFPQDGC